ncbi:LysM peptidoglycan-binding domain-containing protein [Planctomicrobium sp. SH668]|uniref:LysM peptidoglycan-binding domain-containing protein n=1 Tax=Planctomicrobium sp. SH668 TaxID=3448126 RepID=UPI003F5C4908
MWHDAKLGLAMGMLVIGFAVAFCFPKPEEAGQHPQAAIHAPVVIEPLDIIPIRAYQIQSTPVASRDRDQSSEVSNGQPFSGSSSIAMGLSANPVLTPVHHVEVPDPPKIEIEEEVAPTTYRVKAGDTLSKISLETLGSSGRYLELFEENSDLLKSPDSIRIGMELRIPGEKQIAKRDKRSVDSDSENSAVASVAIESVTAAEATPNTVATIDEEVFPLDRQPTNGRAEPVKIHYPPKVPWLVERPSDRQ